MKQEWIHPNTITGDPATDKRYLPRETVNYHFWREVKKGSHILFTAPRRVGKTSLMRYLAENCPEGYTGLYASIEGIGSKKEFFQRLFELILQCAHRSKLSEAKAFFERCSKKYSIKEISLSKISLSKISIDSQELDYAEEIRLLMPELENAKVHTVIFLDEFSEMIHRMKKKGKQMEALDILHKLREMRHNDMSRHFTLVFAGSIGLAFVIKTIGRTTVINDLHSIDLNIFSDEEASRLLYQLTEGTTIRLQDEVLAYIKAKIGYLLPYYLQLVLRKIDNVAFENKDPEVTKETVDIAFQRVLEERKNFQDWLVRLKDYQAEHFDYINSILMHAAQQGQITVPEIYARAREFGRMQDYMEFVFELVDDGYLVETEKQVYRFVSVFLQQFWLKTYPPNHA